MRLETARKIGNKHEYKLISWEWIPFDKKRLRSINDRPYLTVREHNSTSTHMAGDKGRVSAHYFLESN